MVTSGETDVGILETTALFSGIGQFVPVQLDDSESLVVGLIDSTIAWDEDGGVDIPYLNPTASGFIPYDDLTQSEVWGWLNSDAVSGSFTTASIQTSLSSSVNLKLNPPAPTTAEGLPW